MGRLTWVVMVVGVAVDLLVTGRTDNPNRIAVLLFCLTFFGCLVARLAGTIRARKRGRLAPAVLLLGVVLWAAESALLQTAQASGHGEHLATGEVAYLVTYLVFVVYLLLDADYRPARALTTWLETAVICAGSASLAGALLLTPLAEGQPDSAPLLVALVYPVADVVLTLLVVAQVGLRMRTADRKTWQLCLGFLSLAVADASFVGHVLHGSAGSTVWNIVLWGVGFGLIVAAACSQRPPQAIQPTGDMPSSILAAAAVTAVGVLVGRPDGKLESYLVGAAVATLVAAGVRMLLALRDARGAAEAFALARTDDLTNLPNRRGMLARMDEDLSAQRPLALMLMDLNGFKEINDALGHSVGDTILQMCGRRMRAAVPAKVMVARLGGDEFALVVPEDDPITLVEIANDTLSAVREPAIAHGIEIVVDASIGIAIRESSDQQSSTLLRRADVAMYQAKMSGAGALIYEPARDEFSRDRLRMVEDLRHAVAAGDELLLWFQPQIDAATQEICGLEALVRWEHPRHGLIAPAAFLPVARQAGLMPALSEAVIKRAAGHMRSWRSQGFAITVSLNCPPPELLSGVFVRRLLAVIDEAGLEPSDFLLEVTEDSFLADPERAHDIVADVRDQGLRISIDDYGTGFSSLAYLRDLPIDEIKVDRTFVSVMAVDVRSRKIVESTVQMAHALDLRVVAEGVEDAPTAAMLVATGTDVLQGYHIARPMPAGEVLGWVERWRSGLAAITA
jgi:diguanylate cyclase (GGDEF)-like protein